MRINFDMDDTLVATHAYIRDNLSPSTNETAQIMRQCDEQGHAYIHAGKDLQDDIYEQILRKEDFMLESGIAAWVENHFEEFVEFINELKELGHTFSICTHRGWTEYGYSKTIRWLSAKGLELFDDIHCLDSEETPCKLTYLQETYGNDFIIVDDNPSFEIDRAKELAYNKNVLQCVGEHTVPNYVHFRTFSTFHEFKSNLLTLLGVHNESV